MVGMGFFAFHSTRKKIGFTIVTVFVTAFCLLVYGNLTFKYFSKRNNEFNSSPLFDPIAHEFKEICTSSERIKRDYKASSVFDMPYELIKSRKVISDSLALLNRHDLQNMADQWAKDSAFERIKLNDVSKLIDQLQANAKFGSSKEYLKSFKAFNNQKITMMALLQQYSLDKPGNHFNDLLLCDKRIVQLETEMLRIKLDQYKKMIPLYEYWLSYY
jgi:hypothetical protein